MGRGSAVVYTPVGDTIDNGYDLGGSRIYPWSRGLAITPPAMYSNYIGTGNGLPIAPPVASLPSTTGAAGVVAGSAPSPAAAIAAPMSPTASPLPWVVGGLILGVGALYALHYRDERRRD